MKWKEYKTACINEEAAVWELGPTFLRISGRMHRTPESRPAPASSTKGPKSWDVYPLTLIGHGARTAPRGINSCTIPACLAHWSSALRRLQEALAQRLRKPRQGRVRTVTLTTVDVALSQMKRFMWSLAVLTTFPCIISLDLQNNVVRYLVRNFYPHQG